MLAWFGAVEGRAHPAYLTAALVSVEPDGSFHATVRFDTLAFILNDTSARIGNEPMEALLAGPRGELEARLAGAKERLRHGFRVVTGAGDAVVERLDFPGAEEVLAWRDTVKPVLPVVIPVTVSGHLPPQAQTVAARFPSVLEEVILTVERPGEEPYAEPVATGTVSTALPVTIKRARTGSEVVVAKPAGAALGGEGRTDARQGGRSFAGKQFFFAAGILFLLSLLGMFGWRRKGGAGPEH